MIADAKHRQSYNRYTRRGLVDNVGLRAGALVAFYCSIQNSSTVTISKDRYRKKDRCYRLNHRSTTVIRRNSGKKKATDNQNNTRHVPRRLTQMAPSSVLRTDVSARSQWKRSRSVRVARGRSDSLRPTSASCSGRPATDSFESRDRWRRRR